MLKNTTGLLRRTMLDQVNHKIVLVEILKDLYADPALRTILGFKGGTAALLFYDLPRLSVDLDFDLLEETKKELVFKKVKAILTRHGNLREAIEKHYTLLFLLSYAKGKQMVKIDISKRKGLSRFERKSYLGVSALVMKPEDMLACKLAALLTRKKFAMRDVFDLWFFLKNKWEINEAVLQEKTGLTVKQALKQAIKVVRTIKPNRLLAGMGELVDAKQKVWIKTRLVGETVFYLRLFNRL